MRIALVCALAFFGAVPSLAAAPRPAVRIVDLQPVALRGSGFQPYERVRLTVRLGERTSVAKRLRAGPRGRFAVAFREHSLGRCGSELAVSAAGSRGSRVSWVLTQPDCFDE